MSSYWRVLCESCGEEGPQFGRTAGGLTFIDPQLPLDDGGQTLETFLIDHDYHELILRHE